MSAEGGTPFGKLRAGSRDSRRRPFDFAQGRLPALLLLCPIFVLFGGLALLFLVFLRGFALFLGHLL
jgi:hypothetical protein